MWSELLTDLGQGRGYSSLFSQVYLLGRRKIGCPTRFWSIPFTSSMTGKTIEAGQSSPYSGLRIQWGRPLIAKPP